MKIPSNIMLLSAYICFLRHTEAQCFLDSPYVNGTWPKFNETIKIIAPYEESAVIYGIFQIVFEEWYGLTTVRVTDTDGGAQESFVRLKNGQADLDLDYRWSSENFFALQETALNYYPYSIYSRLQGWYIPDYLADLASSGTHPKYWQAYIDTPEILELVNGTLLSTYAEDPVAITEALIIQSLGLPLKIEYLLTGPEDTSFAYQVMAKYYAGEKFLVSIDKASPLMYGDMFQFSRIELPTATTECSISEPYGYRPCDFSGQAISKNIRPNLELDFPAVNAFTKDFEVSAQAITVGQANQKFAGVDPVLTMCQFVRDIYPDLAKSWTRGQYCHLAWWLTEEERQAGDFCRVLYCTEENYEYSVGDCDGQSFSREVQYGWKEPRHCLSYTESGGAGGVDLPSNLDVDCRHVPMGSGIANAGLAMVALTASLALAFMAFVFYTGSEKKMKAQQPFFLVIFLIGVIVHACSMAVITGPNDTPRCILRPLAFHIGFTLMFSALFLKVWRVWRIFGNKKMRKMVVTRWDGMKGVIGLCMVDLLVFIAWYSVHHPRSSVDMADERGVGDIEYTVCDQGPELFGMVLAMYKVFLVVLGCFISYQARNVSKEFSEARLVNIAIFEIAVVYGIYIVVTQMGVDERVKIVLSVVVTTLTLLFILGFIMGIKVMEYFGWLAVPTTPDGFTASATNSGNASPSPYVGAPKSTNNAAGGASLDGSIMDRSGVMGGGRGGGGESGLYVKEVVVSKRHSTVGSYQKSANNSAITSKRSTKVIVVEASMPPVPAGRGGEGSAGAEDGAPCPTGAGTTDVLSVSGSKRAGKAAEKAKGAGMGRGSLLVEDITEQNESKVMDR